MTSTRMGSNQSVSNEDKFEFYDEVMDSMDGELGKRVFRHLFSNVCNKFVSGDCGFDDYSAWTEGK